jgi:excisionase family DNA binding protein
MPLSLAISVNDAALALSLSPWTIRKWIKKGIIPSIRLGRRVLVSPGDLEKFVSVSRSQGAK